MMFDHCAVKGGEPVSYYRETDRERDREVERGRDMGRGAVVI